MLARTKLHIGALAFRISHLDRIHIIGCARSGTTFLQYCMLAYKNAVVVDSEASADYPDLIDKLQLAKSSMSRGGIKYITKRTFGWFQPEKVEELLLAVKRYRMGLILMIRDPRAVLVSTHRLGKDPETPYVDEQRWYQSILAGEEVWRRLADYPRKCVIKYEDLVRYPEVVDRRIMDTFSLERRPGLDSFNQVKANAERIGYRIPRLQQEVMRGLRNADPASLDKPLSDITIRSEEIRAKYTEFLAQFRTSEVGNDHCYEFPDLQCRIAGQQHSSESGQRTPGK